MEITVHLPDDLGARPDPAREALESLAIEGYRAGALSHLQAGQLLGMSRFEFEGFLKERRVYDHAYGATEVEQDWNMVQRDIQQRLEQYTAWLRACPEAAGLSIYPSNDKSPFPYQWKISTPNACIDYIELHGPAAAGSEDEKRQYLCEQLRQKLAAARQAHRLT